MAPVAAFVADERICAPQQNPGYRELDTAVRAPGPTLVRRAGTQELSSLLEIAKSLIPGDHAAEEVVHRVARHRPDSIWAFVHDTRLVGLFAMLLLNAAGVQALLADEIDTKNPATNYLACEDEVPTGIYFWAVAHYSASDGIPEMFVRLRLPHYREANIFAAPATPDGLRFIRKWGFLPVPGHPRNLHQYVRLTKRSGKLGG